MSHPPRSFSVLIALIAIGAAACAPASAPANGESAPGSTPAAVPSSAESQATGELPPADPATAYDCPDLLTDAELQAATGLGDATFFAEEDWVDTPGAPVGQTYCQYFASAGGISIAVSVLTGDAYTVVFVPLFSVPGGEEVAGIGDEARVSDTGDSGAARVGGTAVTVIFTDLSSSGFGSLDVRSAVVAVLELVIGRV